MEAVGHASIVRTALLSAASHISLPVTGLTAQDANKLKDMSRAALLLLALSQPCASITPLPGAAEPLPLSRTSRARNAYQPEFQRSTVSSLERLRGGDSGSMLQKASGMYFGVPIVTRIWLSMILAFAGLSQIGLVAPEALAIDAGAMVGRLQLWRLVTCATFLGGLGMQLLQKLYYMVQFGAGFERTVGMGEYLRILASCTATMSIVCNLLGWQFVGDGLIMAITVLTCQQNPDQQMSLYMITIPCSCIHSPSSACPACTQRIPGGHPRRTRRLSALSDQRQRQTRQGLLQGPGARPAQGKGASGGGRNRRRRKRQRQRDRGTRQATVSSAKAEEARHGEHVCKRSFVRSWRMKHLSSRTRRVIPGKAHHGVNDEARARARTHREYQPWER